MEKKFSKDLSCYLRNSLFFEEDFVGKKSPVNASDINGPGGCQCGSPPWRIALPITGQETSLGRAKLPLSRRTSLAYTELRSFGCGYAALGAMQVNGTVSPR